MEDNHNSIQKAYGTRLRWPARQLPALIVFLPKDYYKVLEVDYDATEENIRLNYLRLALKWHPDKHKGDSAATVKFQEINAAYKVLSDPAKRLDYDLTGIYEIDKYTLGEYLARFKGMILTCNGLGISHLPIWYTLINMNSVARCAAEL